MRYFIEFGLFFLLEDSDSDHDMSAKVSTPCVWKAEDWDQPADLPEDVRSSVFANIEENIFSGVRRW